MEIYPTTFKSLVNSKVFTGQHGNVTLFFYFFDRPGRTENAISIQAMTIIRSVVNTVTRHQATRCFTMT